jgi:hypothetical protein
MKKMRRGEDLFRHFSRIREELRKNYTKYVKCSATNTGIICYKDAVIGLMARREDASIEESCISAHPMSAARASVSRGRLQQSGDD